MHSNTDISQLNLLHRKTRKMEKIEQMQQLILLICRVCDGHEDMNWVGPCISIVYVIVGIT